MRLIPPSAQRYIVTYAFMAAAIALVLLNVIFPDVLLVGVTGGLASMFIQFSLQDPKRLKDG